MVSKDEADPEATGSVGRPMSEGGHGAPQLQEADLAYARAVAAYALAHGGKDSSFPWQNPQTGAGGNVTPLAASYSEGGFICRDFLASYLRGEAQTWLQGEACRTGHGQWEIKSLTPLNRG